MLLSIRDPVVVLCCCRVVKFRAVIKVDTRESVFVS